MSQLVVFPPGIDVNRYTPKREQNLYIVRNARDSLYTESLYGIQTTVTSGFILFTEAILFAKVTLGLAKHLQRPGV